MNRYIVPLLIAFVSCGIFIFYVDGGYRLVLKDNEREADLAKFIVDANNAKEKLADIEGDFNSFPENADKRLNVLLPDRVDPVKLIVDVNHIAELHGMQLANPNVTSEVPNDENPSEVLRHTIRFSVTSTYTTLRQFLRDIELSLSLRDLHNISFKASSGLDAVVSPKDGDVDLTVMQYDVELITYSLR